MDGFYNQLLLIDLSTRKIEKRKLPDSLYRNYLGGKGLGSRLLFDENPPGVSPLSPDNCLIFVIGACTDNKIHGSARYGVITKSPLTGFYCDSYSGGTVADQISRTGVDAIIIRGKSPSPVTLEISDKEVIFNNADDLWGTDAFNTEDALLKKTTQKQAAALCIGPAGENLVPFATISNNYWRCAGRAGTGAVMGSKNLKGILFYGQTRRTMANPETIAAHWKKLIKKSKTDPGVSTYKKYGTSVMVGIMNKAKAFPTRYWQETECDHWQKISGDALLKNCKVQPRACPRCFMVCGNRTEVLKGRHKGMILEGPEYETMYAFGGLCMIQEIEEIIYLNDLCDRLGVDTITTGNLVSFAMLASELGIIDHQAEYGNADQVAEIIRLIARREGIGAILSKGIRYAAACWGLESEAVHVKGLEPPGYDPRVLKGMGLSYAVSPRGACHLRGTFYKAELSGLIPPEKIKGKAKVFLDFEDRLTLFDTLILCRFFRDMIHWEELLTIVAGANGLTLTKSELQKISANINTVIRRFNIREGLTRQDDTLPKALFSKQPAGLKNPLTRSELNYMVEEYYQLRGWDSQGIPLTE